MAEPERFAPNQPRVSTNAGYGNTHTAATPVTLGAAGEGQAFRALFFLFGFIIGIVRTPAGRLDLLLRLRIRIGPPRLILGIPAGNGFVHAPVTVGPVDGHPRTVFRRAGDRFAVGHMIFLPDACPVTLCNAPRHRRFRSQLWAKISVSSQPMRSSLERV